MLNPCTHPQYLFLLQGTLGHRQLYVYSLLQRLLAANKALMADNRTDNNQQLAASSNTTGDQPSSSNIGNYSNQSAADASALLDIPLFNELMLVYEIQYNATKDALRHFLEEQPSLILPLFTNVLWSLLVNPMLAMQLPPNMNFSPLPSSPAADPTASPDELQKIAGELMEKFTNSIVCNVCAKPMKNRAAFVKHRRRHLGISELAFVCVTCGKRCSERRHLAVHCRNKHHEMPSITPQHDHETTEEQDMAPVGESKEESPESINQVNPVNGKVLMKLWQSDDDKNSISVADICNQS